MKRRAGQDGFSLLEVLVAFSILAITLAVVFRVVSGSLRNAELAERYGTAAVIAESVMARIGTEFAPDGGAPGSGNDLGYRWQLTVRPFGDQGVVPLFLVSVTVSWGERDDLHAITLESLRPGRPKQ